MERTAAAPAATARPPIDRPDLVEVAHLLVLLQGAILVDRSIEAVFFLAFTGAAAAVSLGLTAAAATLTLATAAGLARGSRRARRWTLIAEAGVVAVTVVDLVLALVMTGEPIGPVELLVGLVVPVAVIVLLRAR
jgi:hypothetical protein